MVKLKELINEEVHFLKEDEYDDVDWDLYESMDRIKELIFEDFLYRNNEDFSKHAPWTVIPFSILKKLWEDYMKYGYVRYPKQLDKIEGIITRNILKIDIFTFLSGHTPHSPDDDFEQGFEYFIESYIECYKAQFEDPDQLEINFSNPQTGYKKKENMSNCNNILNKHLNELIEEKEGEGEIKVILFKILCEKFWDYYIEDPKSGQARISDYGLDPLLKLLDKLRKEKTPEKKLVLMDNILNVVHQRSDIASWFVQGGSLALSKLSGYITPEDFNQSDV